MNKNLLALALILLGINSIGYSQTEIKHETLKLEFDREALGVVKKNGECSGFAVWDGKLWVANDGYGVFVSADTGKTFETKSTGLQELLVTAINTHKNKLYCATKYKGLYLYSAKMNRWLRLKKGLSDSTFWSLESNGNHIFASSEDNGIFRSKNGIDWERTKVKLDNTIAMDSVSFKGSNILHANSKALYASTPYKVVFTLNNGKSWRKIAAPQFPSLGKIHFVSGDEKTLLVGYFPGGVFSTQNNGVSWKRVCGDSKFYPWSAEVLNGRTWICSIFRCGGGLNVIDEGEIEPTRLGPFEWVNHITYYGGYYFTGGNGNELIKFKYPQKTKEKLDNSFGLAD